MSDIYNTPEFIDFFDSELWKGKVCPFCSNDRFEVMSPRFFESVPGKYAANYQGPILSIGGMPTEQLKVSELYVDGYPLLFSKCDKCGHLELFDFKTLASYYKKWQEDNNG
ncbi:MAG: hypothetical protein LBV04_05905 [Deferribacteraceae bacterium]|jgi:hypothetical protein|nr:hypothetical protein [Deferribacteraceae bacterium]